MSAEERERENKNTLYTAVSQSHNIMHKYHFLLLLHAIFYIHDAEPFCFHKEHVKKLLGCKTFFVVHQIIKS